MSFASRLPIALIFFSLPVFAGSVPGINNFDQVDTHVYRGAQPTNEGFQYLAKLGVKTIIDLREAGNRSKAEELVVTGAGMKYVNVPMTGLTPPADAEITKILAMLEDSTTGPVFVHCWRGADRTGAVIAAYHIDRDNWDNARALRDAKAHRMSSFQIPRQNYIKNFRPRTVNVRATPAADTGAVAGHLAASPTTAGVTN
jgi:protein-tyrosine phosphatase